MRVLQECTRQSSQTDLSEPFLHPNSADWHAECKKRRYIKGTEEREERPLLFPASISRGITMTCILKSQPGKGQGGSDWLWALCCWGPHTSHRGQHSAEGTRQLTAGWGRGRECQSPMASNSMPCQQCHWAIEGGAEPVWPHPFADRLGSLATLMWPFVYSNQAITVA